MRAPFDCSLPTAKTLLPTLHQPFLTCLLLLQNSQSASFSPFTSILISPLSVFIVVIILPLSPAGQPCIRSIPTLPTRSDTRPVDLHTLAGISATRSPPGLWPSTLRNQSQ